MLTRDWTGELNFTLGKELHDLSHRFREGVCVSEREREREIEREREREIERAGGIRFIAKITQTCKKL